MAGVLRVALRNSAIRSALGDHADAVWSALASPPAPEAMPGVVDGMRALYASEPQLTALGIDRKLARTMEKQARMMLATAATCLADESDGRGAERGLYLGLPTVDEPIPGMVALENWHADRGREPIGAHLQRETPPFSGLSMLNSSAAAHIAATLRMTGSLAVYSPFADAGLNALVDGACAVADGECTDALIGAVSPKIDPMLPLQYQRWTEPGMTLAAGEACASLLASPAGDDADEARLLGYARGYASLPWNDDGGPLPALIAQALSMAERHAGQVGWIVHSAPWRSCQRRALDAALTTCWPMALPPRLDVERSFGRIGPAATTLAASLALQALQRGECHDNESRRCALTQPTVLVIAMAPHGQCGVIVIGKEQA